VGRASRALPRPRCERSHSCWAAGGGAPAPSLALIAEVRPYGLTATAVSCSAFSAVAAFSADALHRLVLPIPMNRKFIPAGASQAPVFHVDHFGQSASVSESVLNNGYAGNRAKLAHTRSLTHLCAAASPGFGADRGPAPTPTRLGPPSVTSPPGAVLGGQATRHRRVYRAKRDQRYRTRNPVSTGRHSGDL
jgi:hypothetical protein